MGRMGDCGLHSTRVLPRTPRVGPEVLSVFDGAGPHQLTLSGMNDGPSPLTGYPESRLVFTLLEKCLVDIQRYSRYPRDPKHDT